MKNGIGQTAIAVRRTTSYKAGLSPLTTQFAAGVGRAKSGVVSHPNISNAALEADGGLPNLDKVGDPSDRGCLQLRSKIHTIQLPLKVHTIQFLRPPPAHHKLNSLRNPTWTVTQRPRPPKASLEGPDKSEASINMVYQIDAAPKTDTEGKRAAS